MSEEIIKDAEENNGGYFDAFVGLAKTYVGAKYSESSRERLEPANQARGNTDTIYQPERGRTQAGETVLVTEQGIDVKKVATYGAIGFGFLVVAGVVYKVVK